MPIPTGTASGGPAGTAGGDRPEPPDLPIDDLRRCLSEKHLPGDFGSLEWQHVGRFSNDVWRLKLDNGLDLIAKLPYHPVRPQDPADVLIKKDIGFRRKFIVSGPENQLQRHSRQNPELETGVTVFNFLGLQFLSGPGKSD